jgi:hypothetical protein
VRPHEDAGGAANGVITGLARGGDGREWPGVALDAIDAVYGAVPPAGESTANPNRRRADPREAGSHRPRRRTAGPLLGLAKIRKVGARGCGGGGGEGIILG